MLVFIRVIRVKTFKYMKQRVCIVEGNRTPMCKAGDLLKDTSADELGVYSLKHLLYSTNIPKKDIDHVIYGNVSMPADAANIARVIALKAGLPENIPAHTVQRNCASGMESIISGVDKINLGQANVVITGGSESMSNIPFLFRKPITEKFVKLSRAKTLGKRLKSILKMRPSDFKPHIALLSGLTDPVTGNIMGKTAEFLAREFRISRQEQDNYAHNSHMKALQSQKGGVFADEIVPIPVKPKYKRFLDHDIGIDKDITHDKLARLRPYFDRLNGTVTVGNSCQITDGAASVLLVSEDYAKKNDLKILGYITNYAYAALSPDRMGLGPVYSVSELLNKNGRSINDYDLFEINEAFAAQVIANIKAFKSDEFSQKFLNREKAIGELDTKKLNIDGGAIALGHPVGMSGTRIVLHLLKQLKKKSLKRGIATLCVGGGQGVAVELETE